MKKAVTRIRVQTQPTGIHLTTQYHLPCIVYTKHLGGSVSVFDIPLSAQTAAKTRSDLLRLLALNLSTVGDPSALDLEMIYWPSSHGTDAQYIGDDDNAEVVFEPRGMLVIKEAVLALETVDSLVVHFVSPSAAPSFYPWIVLPRTEKSVEETVRTWLPRFREDGMTVQGLKILETRCDLRIGVEAATILYNDFFRWHLHSRWPRARGLAFRSWDPEVQWKWLRSWGYLETRLMDENTLEIRTVPGIGSRDMAGEAMSWLASTWYDAGYSSRMRPVSTHVYPMTFDGTRPCEDYHRLVDELTTQVNLMEIPGTERRSVDYASMGAYMSKLEKRVVQPGLQMVCSDHAGTPYGDPCADGFEVTTNIHEAMRNDDEEGNEEEDDAHGVWKRTFSIQPLPEALPRRSGGLLHGAPMVDVRRILIESMRAEPPASSTLIIVSSPKQYQHWRALSTPDERAHILQIKRPVDLRGVARLPEATRLILDVSFAQASALSDRFEADFASRDRFSTIWWVDASSGAAGLTPSDVAPLVKTFRWTPSTSAIPWKRIIFAFDVPPIKRIDMLCALLEDERTAYTTLLSLLETMAPLEEVDKAPRGYNCRAYTRVLEGMLSICTGGRLPTHLRSIRGMRALTAEELAELQRDEDEVECSICMDALENPQRTECGHVFCESCIECSVQARDTCPYCRFQFQFQTAEGSHPEEEPSPHQRRFPLQHLMDTLRTLYGRPRSRVLGLHASLRREADRFASRLHRPHTLVLYNDPHAWTSIERIQGVDRPIVHYRGDPTEDVPSGAVVFAPYTTLATLLDKIDAAAFRCMYLADPYPARMHELMGTAARHAYLSRTPLVIFKTKEESIERVVYREIARANARPIMERFSTLMRTVYPDWEGEPIRN